MHLQVQYPPNGKHKEDAISSELMCKIGVDDWARVRGANDAILTLLLSYIRIRQEMPQRI